jgi:hypothetical protein
MAAKGKVTGKGKGVAADMKIKPGPSGKMYGNQKVSPQKAGVTATSQTRSRTSYAK